MCSHKWYQLIYIRIRKETRVIQHYIYILKSIREKELKRNNIIIITSHRFLSQNFVLYSCCLDLHKVQSFLVSLLLYILFRREKNIWEEKSIILKCIFKLYNERNTRGKQKIEYAYKILMNNMSFFPLYTFNTAL